MFLDDIRFFLYVFLTRWLAIWSGLGRVVEEGKILLIVSYQIWRKREGEAELTEILVLATL